MTRFSAYFVLLALAACGPVSLQQAEEECYDKARLAEQPRGEISIGVDQGGNVGTEISIGISSDYLQGRDPSQVYNDCVMQRAGQMPSQPYYTLPPP